MVTNETNTSSFFAGGSGMLIQYHDIIKPVYLYAIIKMIMSNDAFGLPIHILKNMSMLSLLEWYINRRNINPLTQLDYNHQVDPIHLDKLLRQYINSDKSLYELSPQLPTMKIFDVYRSQHMTFPIYVYSEENEPHIESDLSHTLYGTKYKYVYGDLKQAIQKTDENFTYIFSDIELVNKATEILKGTCSNVLLPRDYQYNYRIPFKEFKYDLSEMSRSRPFNRIETIVAMDLRYMTNSFSNITGGG